MASVLIIDDDRQMNAALGEVVADLGHSVAGAHTLSEGLSCVHSGNYDVVFLDVRLPDGSGLEAIHDIRDAPATPEVIIITAYDDTEGAALAITNGAWDYIRKPASIEEMTLPLVRAVQYRSERAHHTTVKLKRDRIIGSGKRIEEALEKVAQAASTDANVLITGETGTGKELFARTIHENSELRTGRFVVVDCTALPDTLVESILFGHRRGAFTGADRDREGLLEMADGGTAFLDEIGELPLSLQKSFLRVLQERRFLPLGAKQEITSDFRVIAATNRDPEAMVRTGGFREDLLYRINAIPLHLAPLRERIEDIRDLIVSYTDRYCTRYGLESKGFAPEFFDAMMAYPWPGNVRELINTLDRVLSAARDERTLFHYHLPTHIRITLAQSGVDHGGNGSGSDAPPIPHPLPVALGSDYPTLYDFREAMERYYLNSLLRATNGRRDTAHRTSGLSRSRFFALLKKYRITD